MRVITRRRGRNERGAAAVEFALVVIPLLAVVLGTINFGFVLSDQIAINNGARQAVRMAVVPGNDCAAIQTEARGASVSVEPNEASIAVRVLQDGVAGCGGAQGPCAGATAPRDITVQLEKRSRWLIPFLPPFTGAGPLLEAEGVMRCEFS